MALHFSQCYLLKRMSYLCCVVLYVCHVHLLRHGWLFATLWTVAHQATLSMEFSQQEYFSGLPFLLQGICPPQGLNQCLLHLLHCKLGTFTSELLEKPIVLYILYHKWIDHIGTVLFLGPLFCSIRLYVYHYASIILFWLLCLCIIIWSQEASFSSFVLSQNFFDYLESVKWSKVA